LLPMYERVRKKLNDLKRAEWAQEELAALLRRSLADDPDREPWRKLRSLGGLDGRQLAVVREVFAWREERAAKLNRPARFLLRDDLVVEIARRLPETEKDIAVMRGVAKHDVTGLLAAVQRGQSTPDEHQPIRAERENDPPQLAIVAGILQSYLASFCAEHRLTPALVATVSDVKAVVRARMEETDLPATCALASGWRAKHILPALEAVLDGRKAICIEDVGAAAPLGLIDADTAS